MELVSHSALSHHIPDPLIAGVMSLPPFYSQMFLQNSRIKRHLSAIPFKPTSEDNIYPTATQKSVESNLFRNSNNTVTIDDSSEAAASSLSSIGSSPDDTFASTARNTAVILITLTIIFFTLVATYLLWRKHRSSTFSAASHCNRLEEYRYSRLSQNDVEVDNISFQGDLIHKTLMNSVPVCAEEEGGEGDQVCPATLRLDYDSLVSISSDDRGTRHCNTHQVNHNSSTANDTPVNLLINELSDEDLLQ